MKTGLRQIDNKSRHIYNVFAIMYDQGNYYLEIVVLFRSTNEPKNN